jgi:predicted dienelactone hydrolase
MRACILLVSIVLCALPFTVRAAGFRTLEVPADAGGPRLTGALWTPCAQPPHELVVDGVTLSVVRDCAIRGDRLPLVVVSHGGGGSYLGHADTAIALADAGFVVATINHAGDTVGDRSQWGELAIFVRRPADIKRLVDHVLTAPPAAAAIDRDRIGLFGYSRGGYTGLVALGAAPDWAAAIEYCRPLPGGICREINARIFPADKPVHDPRIRAAVIADPLAIYFSPASYRGIRAPIQLWGSQHGGDGVTPASVGEVNARLPAPHEWHLVPRAGHFVFLAPCSAKAAAEDPEICVDAHGFDRVAFHRQLNAEMIAFFRKHL